MEEVEILLYLLSNETNLRAKLCGKRNFFNFNVHDNNAAFIINSTKYLFPLHARKIITMEIKTYLSN